MQIIDIFHNCPEEQQEQQQQSDPKDLGSKFPRSKKILKNRVSNRHYFSKQESRAQIYRAIIPLCSRFHEIVL